MSLRDRLIKWLKSLENFGLGGELLHGGYTLRAA